MRENRFITRTQKIGAKETGLKGSIFVHVDFDDTGKFHALDLSEKGKDESTLDKILAAISASVTDIVQKGVV